MNAGTVAGRTVLVTGATGFLGAHMVRALDAADAKVHALVRPGRSLRRLEDLQSRITLWLGDVTDYESVLRCCRGAMPTAIVHLAGDTTDRRLGDDWAGVGRSVAVQLHGTLNVVRGAVESGAPVSVLLRAGGLEEYGTGAIPYDELQRERPSSPYSAGQVAATHFCQMLQPRLEFALTTLRPALVYGPGQSESFFIPGLIQSCLWGRPFDMTAGEQRRDLLYVDDLIQGFFCALNHPELRGAIINLGSGEEVAIRDVAEEIVRLTGAHGILHIGAAAERAGDLRHLVARIARAETILGWRPTVGLTEGLRRTIAWQRAQSSREER